jgi:hypothetical protein
MCWCGRRQRRTRERSGAEDRHAGREMSFSRLAAPTLTSIVRLDEGIRGALSVSTA